MPLTVTSVNNRRDIERFIRLPWRLHGADPCWIPPLIGDMRRTLDPSRNPFFRQADARYFLALRDGREVGRIAAVENKAFNELYGTRTGFWGFFECERDSEAAGALFAAVKDELRSRGMTDMQGPMNPSINTECGLLIEGFDQPPTIHTPHNPPWYAELVEAAGLEPVKDLLAYMVLEGDVDAARRAMRRLKRLTDAIRRRIPDVVVRTLDMSRYEEETGILNGLFNEARRGNWGFVPVSDEEFAQTTRQMKAVVDPRIIIVGEKEGRIVGCLLAIPDINPLLKKMNGSLLPLGWLHFLRGRRRLKRARVFGAATIESCRHLGITPLLIYQLIQNCLDNGYKSAELSWVAEDNRKSLSTIENALKITPYKKYRIYGADIAASASPAVDTE